MDASFWATVALAIFIAVIVYYRVPAMIARALDQRAERIRNELDTARRLREEAQQLLAEYQRKRKEAEKEAEGIISAARREASRIVEEARQRTEEYIARRQAMAEAKIAQAEREAVAEVRARAVDIAVEAAGEILSAKIDGKKKSELFVASLDRVKRNLN
jgi:F-type H+-transporting ATPase subunit b